MFKLGMKQPILIFNLENCNAPVTPEVTEFKFISKLDLREESFVQGANANFI